MKGLYKNKNYHNMKKLKIQASPAVSCMSGSSELDSFRDGRQVAV